MVLKDLLRLGGKRMKAIRKILSDETRLKTASPKQTNQSKQVDKKREAMRGPRKRSLHPRIWLKSPAS